MKVLVISHEYPMFGGGAGVVAKQIVDDFNKRGMEIDLLTYKRDDNCLSGLSNVHEVSYYGLPWFFAYYIYIKMFIKIDSYDLIICNDIISQYISGVAFSKKTLKKCVMLLHGSEPEYVYLDKSYRKKIIFTELVYNRLLKNIGACLSHSIYMKNKFYKYSSVELDKDYIDVSYFGFDSSIFKEEEYDNVKKELNIKDDDIVLLTVGRIVKQKGFLRKLKIFNEIRKVNNKFKWVIVGDGPYLDEFKLIIKTYSLESDVIFTGKKERSELSKYYSLANVFWLLSEYKESFGLVYIEAQGCGTPAIGNNKYGVKEAILNGITGLLANSDNEIIKYLIDFDFLKHDKFDVIEFAQSFKASDFSQYIIEIANKK